MKRCVDCHWMTKGLYGEGICNSPKNTKTELKVDRVFGGIKLVPKWPECQIHRNMNLLEAMLGRFCGQRARWFRAKAT